MDLDKLIKQGLADQDRNRYIPPEKYEVMWNNIEDRIRRRKYAPWYEPFYRSFFRHVPATMVAAIIILLFAFGRGVFYPSHVYEDIKENPAAHRSVKEQTPGGPRSDQEAMTDNPIFSEADAKDKALLQKALAYPSFQRVMDFSQEPPLLEELVLDFWQEGIPYEIIRVDNAPKNVDWEGRVIEATAREGILFLTVQDKNAPRKNSKELIDERLKNWGIQSEE
ncbi:MAG: hypothetical protein ACOX6S_15115 [Clostridia bacterium]|jgi:hypothetical protein